MSQFQLDLTFYSLAAYSTLLALGLILGYLITALVSAFGFWLIEMTPMLASLSIVTAILSGRMVPLTFFPDWTQSFILFLPFRYLVYDPILAITGQLTNFDFWQTVLKALVWIIVFYFLNYFAWQKGFKKFDAVGN